MAADSLLSSRHARGLGRGPATAPRAAGRADAPRRDRGASRQGQRVDRGVGMWLELVRAPPSGTWERRRADLYAAAEEWLGPGDVKPPDAVEHLLRRYLGGFGPASRREIADWAGMPVRAVARALDRLRLRSFSSEDGEELVDLPRAPLPDPDIPAPVRFLPVWDATLLAHKRRKRR
ncbi:MAG: DNA glycosylase AlkZ-like family protein [Solirubrobacterales bacterium]